MNKNLNILTVHRVEDQDPWFDRGVLTNQCIWQNLLANLTNEIIENIMEYSTSLIIKQITIYAS